jgi:hypothetical protein
VAIDERTLATGLPRAHAAEGLGSIEAEEWDALVPPGLGPLRHATLLAWEQCELAALRSQPLVVRAPRGGELLAAAPGYLYDLDAVAIQQSGALGAVLRSARRLAPRFLTMRVYELGCAAPCMPPFLHAPEVDAVDAAEQLLEAALREAAVESSDMVIVQDFRDDAAFAQLLASHGFARIPMHPTIVADVRPFDSFDDYVASMRSNYRRRVKIVWKRSSHLYPEVVDDFAPYAQELARLWRLVFDRATEYRREILPPEYFVAAAADEAMSVLLLRRPDDSIASFAVLLADQPVLHFLSCGFDERVGLEEGAYFRLLYEIVRLGIDGGYDRVNLGMTTAEPKFDVGGLPVPLHAWMRHRRRVLHRSFAALGAGPFAPEPLEPRRVFKD